LLPILKTHKEKGERGLYFWAVARESYIGFAYNKKLLSPNALPKNYEGLLHPALKGRMGMSVSDPSYKVIGAIIRTRGLELVKKLKTQEIALLHDYPASSARLDRLG
jgi:ABC-type Fe3+ transport system substrate-binding protein